MIRSSPRRLTMLSVLVSLASLIAPATTLLAQAAVQTGTIAGRVQDERGEPVGNAQVYLHRPPIGTQCQANGMYVLTGVPVGEVTVLARMLGLQPDSGRVTVRAGERVTLDFTLHRDPLHLQTLIVTGTQVPRQNLAASVEIGRAHV